MAVIASVDESVGRLLEYLDKNNLTDNTIIVYTSDQGFYMGEHGWFDKRFMYEESFHTPLIISYPKHIQPKSECNQMVQNIDFALPSLTWRVWRSLSTCLEHRYSLCSPDSL